MGLIDLVFGDRSERKRALLERARTYLERGRVDKALLTAERALKLDPDGEEARATLGQIQLRLGQLAWADGDIEGAVECHTQAARLLSDPVALFYRGLAHRDAKQYLRAIEDFSRVLRSEELSALPYANYATFCRGLCYSEMGEHKHAIKDFTACLEADPESPLRHRFLVQRALVRNVRGEHAEAQADLRAAEALAPRATEVAAAREALSRTDSQPARGLPAPAPSPAAEPGARALTDDLLDVEELHWVVPEAAADEDDEPTPVERAPWLAEVRPEPAGGHDRLAALRAKRDAAFAEREALFGKNSLPQPGEMAPPPPRTVTFAARAHVEPAIPPVETATVLPQTAAAAEATPGTTVPTVGETRPPPQPSSEGPSQDRAPAEVASSPRAERCVDKLDELLNRFASQEDLFEDLDFCIDYLLVVARLRELPREEKLVVSSRLTPSMLEQLEAAESRALDRLLATPNAAGARTLAGELKTVLRGAPSPDRLRGAPLEPKLRSIVLRFEELSRAQKYLFLDACGRRTSARFTDYLIVFGSREARS